MIVGVAVYNGCTFLRNLAISIPTCSLTRTVSLETAKDG